MSLQTKFEQFRQNIEPTSSQIDSIISSHTHLRQNILQKLNYVKNTILTGSYKRKTLIRPINDIDVFVILNYQPNTPITPTPQSILNKLKSDLQTSYSDSTIKQDKPCITLEFQKYKFELTPAIESNPSGLKYYYIPNQSNLNNWLQIDDPEILGAKLSYQNNNRFNQMLIPLIKMMKKCKQKNKLNQPKSFEMEILAMNNLSLFNTYRQGVQQLLGIYGWLKPSDLLNLQNMTDDDFALYCKNTLFGLDFPA
jgi:hypothetical protein